MAAAVAATAGLSVLLLEKRNLPRHKTCGGGMPMVVADHIRDLAPEAFVESDVQFMRHSFQFKDPHVGAMNLQDNEKSYSLWMVQRSIFDNALSQRAVQCGATLQEGGTLRSISLEPSIIELQIVNSSTLSTITTDFVIGADGANGITSRLISLRKNRTLAIALEVEHPYQWELGHPILRRDICHLEYGAVPRGYAWVFPKGDHLNVGAGVFRPRKTGKGDAAVAGELR